MRINIKNNFFGPPPFYNNCFCNSYSNNSLFTMMAGLNLFNNFLSNTFTPNQYGVNPYTQTPYYPQEGAGGKTPYNSDLYNDYQKLNEKYNKLLLENQELKKQSKSDEISKNETLESRLRNNNTSNVNNEADTEDAVISDETTTNTNNTNSENAKSDSKVSKSPKGWYRASNDRSQTLQYNKTILTEKAKKANITPAQCVANDVIASKTGYNFSKVKDELVNFIIQKNPSVFDKNGNLKKNADLSKLDIPTSAWIKKNTFTAEKTIKGANGYTATVFGNGFIVYKDNKGIPISPNEFKNHCPTIYVQINK